MMVRISKPVAKTIKKKALTPNESYDNILKRMIAVSPHETVGVGKK